MQIQTQPGRLDVDRIAHRGDIGQVSQGGRVDAQEEVHHRRIADNRGLVDLIPTDAGPLRHLVDHLVKALQGPLSQRLQPVGSLDRHVDAPDYVVPVGGLAIHGRCETQVTARHEIDKRGHHCGRAQIQCHAEAVLRRIALLHPDEPVPPHNDRDRLVLPFQHLGQTP